MITIKGQLLNKGEYTSPTRTLIKRIFTVLDITQQPPQQLPFEFELHLPAQIHQQNPLANHKIRLRFFYLHNLLIY